MARLPKALLLAGLWLALPAAQANPIYGVWYLDTERSDDPRKELQSKQSKKRKKQQAQQAQQAQALPQQRPPRPSPLPLLDAKTLRIEAHGEQLEIIPDEGRALRVVPDGQAAPVSLSDWGKADTNPVQFGSWEGDTLVMESSIDAGPHLIQTYSVDQDGLLLQRTEILRPPADTVVINRYFRDIDPQTAAASEAAEPSEPAKGHEKH